MVGKTVKILSFFSWGITASVVLIFFSYILANKVQRDRDIHDLVEKKIATYKQIQLSATKIQEGKNTDAIELLQLVLNQNPNNYDARYLMAETLAKECTQKDTLCDIALWQLSILLKQFPNSIQGYELRKTIYLHLGDLNGAENDQLKIQEIQLGI